MTREEITGLVQSWSARMLLGHWRINVRFADAQPNDGPEVVAETATNNPYRDATITFYPLIAAKSDSEMERVVVHELAHIITRRMKGAAWDLVHGNVVTWREVKEHDEELTDAVALALLHVRDISEQKWRDRYVEHAVTHGGVGS